MVVHKTKTVVVKKEIDVLDLTGEHVEAPPSSSTQPQPPAEQPQQSLPSRLKPSNLITMHTEQTHAMPFPPGCPVLYNFRTNAPYNTTVCRGVVKSVSLDLDSRKLYYEVGRNRSINNNVSNDEDDDKTTTLILEDELAYANKCPVKVTACVHPFDDVEGEIVHAKPTTTAATSKSNDGKLEIFYTVMYEDTNNDELQFEERVTADRIKYRNNYTVQATGRHEDLDQKPSAKNSKPLDSLKISNEIEDTSQNEVSEITERSLGEEEREGNEKRAAVAGIAAGKSGGEAIDQTQQQPKNHAAASKRTDEVPPIITCNSDKTLPLSSNATDEVTKKVPMIDIKREPSSSDQNERHKTDSDMQQTKRTSDADDSPKSTDSNKSLFSSKGDESMFDAPLETAERSDVPKAKTGNVGSQSTKTNSTTSKTMASAPMATIPKQEDATLKTLKKNDTDPLTTTIPRKRKCSEVQIAGQSLIRGESFASLKDAGKRTLELSASPDSINKIPRKKMTPNPNGTLSAPALVRGSSSQAKQSGKMCAKEPLTLQLTVPRWVKNLNNLYNYILGDNRIRAKHIMSNTNCTIHISRCSPHQSTPMKITITSKHQYAGTIERDLLNAKEAVEKHIIDYLKDNQARCRLLYELSVTSSGSLDIPCAKSGAVQFRSHTEHNLIWAQLLEVPALSKGVLVGSGKNLSIDAKMLQKIQARAPCSVEAFGGSSMCAPYVFIIGNALNPVDEATALLTGYHPPD